MNLLPSVVIFAIILDLFFGDPTNKYHPTFWVGKLIGKIVPMAKTNNPTNEKLNGVMLVISIVALVSLAIFSFDSVLKYFTNLEISQISKILIIIFSVISSAILLKTTIAIKGMEFHAIKIMESLSKNNLEDARTKLSMIVKRNTKNLDRQHILSATLESLSENIVDGITGPLFYFSFFGLIGAFAYRTVNTFDSMIGYKTEIFRNLGWFGANCDKILNFIPSRLTGLMMILSCILLGKNWKHSLIIMKRDGPRTESPNAGYPMAAMAGALGIKFEKMDHYTLGNGDLEITESHFKDAISIMKTTVALFVALFVIPIILILSYFDWWSFV